MVTGLLEVVKGDGEALPEGAHVVVYVVLLTDGLYFGPHDP